VIPLELPILVIVMMYGLSVYSSKRSVTDSELTSLDLRQSVQSVHGSTNPFRTLRATLATRLSGTGKESGAGALAHDFRELDDPAMLERLSTPNIPTREILLDCRLVVRDSCGARACGDQSISRFSDGLTAIYG
jgi:hypothetical protein